MSVSLPPVPASLPRPVVAVGTGVAYFPAPAPIPAPSGRCAWVASLHAPDAAPCHAPGAVVVNVRVDAPASEDGRRWLCEAHAEERRAILDRVNDLRRAAARQRARRYSGAA